MTKGDSSTGDGKNITFRDVIIHMQHMEQRLSSKIDANAEAVRRNGESIKANTVAVKTNATAIQNTKEALMERMDALDEDLTATMKDTVTIRKHVGMAITGDD